MKKIKKLEAEIAGIKEVLRDPKITQGKYHALYYTLIKKEQELERIKNKK